ncbi:hypothetical protein [Streptomyces aureoversilis]|uniref:Uncharacterized protein n=1 Tax=Streptomyces aureoversilis TaxID=67277 RepID=A0ABW0A8R5_9ACTN
MRKPQLSARDAIAKAVTTAVRRSFAEDHEDFGFAHDPLPAPAFRAGSQVAGHDSSRVPVVPEAEVAIRQTDDGPGLFFSYKAEYGQPPLWQMSVRHHWQSEVADAGWAVLDGRPVVDVLEWDETAVPRRPARVLTAKIWGEYDPSFHGWRSWADTITCRVDWTDTGHPVMTPPLGEPRSN